MKRRWSQLLFFAVLVLVFGLVVGGPLSDVSRYGETGVNSTDSVTVTFVGSDGVELGQITGPIADTWTERRTGLSDTESLDPNEGMVFVYEDEGTRAFVMRNMSFPLDIIFVGEDGQITAIYHAAADADRHFSAQARWVIEVNQGYTDTHNVSVGDEVQGLPR
ncbi:DUF192 domain-containing protein [Halodesulfurarchaeum sp.]|uniref:DUF192 domain-containing protein n=1 Tax=Halodesulfurarchaeum sp. TaxID=1980530 RepID=UPI002FC376A2